MKKIITFTLSLFLLFSAVACGNRTENTTEKNKNTTKRTEESGDKAYYNTYTGLYNENIGTLGAYDMYTDVNTAENAYKDKEYPGNEKYLSDVRAAYEDSRDKIQSFVDGLKNEGKTDNEEFSKMNEDLIKEGENLIKDIDKKITRLNKISEKDYEKSQTEFIRYVHDTTTEGENGNNKFRNMLEDMDLKLGIDRKTMKENNNNNTTK